MVYTIYTDLSCGFGEFPPEAVEGDKVKVLVRVAGQELSKSLSLNVNGRTYPCFNGVCFIPKNDLVNGVSRIKALLGGRLIPMEDILFDGKTVQVIKTPDRDVHMLYAKALGELYQKVSALTEAIEKMKKNGGHLL